MIKKMLIVNRGEIAVRIIQACRAMNIKTVAAYSDCDKDTLAVFLADETVCIGNNEPSQSYLNIDHIISAALGKKCDAIHPGYGFLSENAEFAKRAKENNLLFIGPSPAVLLKTADKSSMKKTANSLGVPTIPPANNHFPLMLKSSYGGGGKGITIVNNETELNNCLEAAKIELNSAFKGDGFLYEKIVDIYKHIDIQFISDKAGNISIFPPRDCSVQRRYQKLIEETPAASIPADLLDKMSQDTAKITSAVGYDNVGTAEFIVDKQMNYYFLEVNSRLQVEHTITEEATGVDLIEQQIELAMGRKNGLPRFIKAKKHAIECRVSANTPGELNIINLPSGKDIRVDTAVYQNYIIKPFYDPLIAKIITSDKSRTRAIAKAKLALDSTIIMGTSTNINELYQIINSNEYRSGHYSIFEESEK